MTLLFCFFTTATFTQTIQDYYASEYAKLDTNKFQKLTFEQKIQDFDFFVNTIQNTFPSLRVKKEVEKIDFMENMERLRKEITPQMSTAAFYVLMEEAVHFCQNSHTGIGFSHSKQKRNEAQINSDFLTFVSGHQRFLYLNLELCYINGNYYNVIPFEKDGIIIEKGWQLTSCNGQDINEVVQSLIPYRNLKWDVENERHYDVRFYRSPNFQYDSLRLVFVNQEGTTYRVNFSIKEKVNFLESVIYTASDMQARFLDNQILYLRIPRMRNQENYMKVLKEFQQKDSIQYLIMDIRGNGGGDDDVWRSIVAQFSDTVISYNLALGFSNKEAVLGALKKMMKISKKLQEEIQPEPIPLLGGQKICLLDLNASTKKFKHRVFKNTKKIFVFADDDCYSSSLVFTKLALQNDNIISIGVNAGWIGGMGIAPLQFQMPNSKLNFIVECTIDLQNIENLKELYTPVENELKLTPDYFHARKTKWDIDFDWLNENDPYFQWVINYIKS
jgi:hypothetical protein